MHGCLPPLTILHLSCLGVDLFDNSCVVWCGVVWLDVVWCGVVWCGVVWFGVVWCGVVWCGVVWYDVAWCGALWHSNYTTVFSTQTVLPVLLCHGAVLLSHMLSLIKHLKHKPSLLYNLLLNHHSYCYLLTECMAALNLDIITKTNNNIPAKKS